MINRRGLTAYLALLTTGLALPVRAQDLNKPVVGFLRSSAAGPFSNLVSAFRTGLAEAGYVEGKNVTIEFRWAENKLERLPALVQELIHMNAAVIVGNSVAIDAARKATTTLPLVFVSADNPLKSGLVKSLNRPEGNLTGVTFFGGGQLGAKRLELLNELVPAAKSIAIIIDANYPAINAELPIIDEAAKSLGLATTLARLSDVSEFDAAFAKAKADGAEAVLIGGSSYFTSKRKELVAAAAAYKLPAIFDQRDHVVDGGLISYAASITDAYKQSGLYAGRILQGAKPGDLPVVQPTIFELVVNLKTADALGLVVPPSVTLRATEIIE